MRELMFYCVRKLLMCRNASDGDGKGDGKTDGYANDHEDNDEKKRKKST